MENKEIPELQMLLRAVEEKYGRPLRSTNDFNALSAIISYECREVLSASTLKRLWGYVSLRTTPRGSTLDILARFVGYRDFADFRMTLYGKEDNTSGYLETTCVLASDIPEAGELTLGWAPNRLVRLRKVGPERFEVLSSLHAKLQQGDRFDCSCFFLGLPLVLPSVERAGQTLPSYIAGKAGGLNLVRPE